MTAKTAHYTQFGCLISRNGKRGWWYMRACTEVLEERRDTYHFQHTTCLKCRQTACFVQDEIACELSDNYFDWIRHRYAQEYLHAIIEAV